MRPIKKSAKLPVLPLSCGSHDPHPLPPFYGVHRAGTRTRLDGTGWTLTGYMHNGTVVPAIPGTTITMDFGTEGKISGSAGCNHYFAS